MKLELKWYVKKVKKQNGKEVEVYYISVPAKVAFFLRKYKPFLDLEKKVIVFEGGDEKNE
jgi:chemotaxis methyl-accepting protein methylase